MKMYENMKEILRFLFKSCEEVGDQQNIDSIVAIKLLKGNRNQGHVQIDVDGLWLKNFDVRLFLLHCTAHEGRLRCKVYYGNDDTATYYFYDLKVKRNNNPETVLKVDKKRIDKLYYLRVVVVMKMSLLNNILVTLREFLKEEMLKFPNVNISLDESLYNDKGSDEMSIKMIAEGFTDVLHYAVNRNFRKNIFDELNVTSKEAAAAEVANLFKNLIGK